MKISVKRARHDVFAISFNGTVHTLGPYDLKRLVLEVVRAMTPGVLPEMAARDEAAELATRLHAIDDAGLQAVLIAADDRDMMAFLKATEADEVLHARIFANMSERRHKMLMEDLSFRFQHDGALDDQALRDAVARLADTVSRHHPAATGLPASLSES